MKYKTVIGVLLYVSITVLLYHFPKNTFREVDATVPPPSPPRLKVQPSHTITEQPEIKWPETPPVHKIVSATLGPGDTLARVLKRLGLDLQTVAELALNAQKEIDLRRLCPGDSIKLYLEPESNHLIKAELEKENQCIVTIEEHDGTFSVKKRPVTLTAYLFPVQGEIEDSFYNAARYAGLTPQTILDFTDIFAWDIDFLTDIQPGDRFSLVYEKLYRNGEFVRDGRILAARFINEGKRFEAFYFKNETGKVGYYEKEGKSLRKAFLKSPLRYTRISSYYSHKRFHPILKIYRPHLGIDYAAPIGTPVSTIGDGRVIYKGWDNGYGRCVKIRHNSVYTSLYGHLNSYARGIKTGAWVQQGQAIGRVGRSGLATGPHLDFRLIKNGSYINPLTLRSPSADPVPQEYMDRFGGMVSRLTCSLNALDRIFAFASDNGRFRAIP